ncbi:MAG TPA: GWxTD domain-containing protein [bacterium]
MTVLLIFLAAAPLNFFVDPVIFQMPVALQDSTGRVQAVPQGVFYAEFNCEIPYQDLDYAETDSQITASVEIRFKMLDRVHQDSLTDVLKRDFGIVSFKTAAQEELAFIVQFGMFVNEGSYQYEVNIVSGGNQGAVVDSLIVDREAYPFSSVLLASAIKKDTSSGYLCKGDLRVVPRPSHLFKENDKNLFVYFELYKPDPTGQPLVVTYEIIDSSGKALRRVSQSVKKTYRTQPVNAGLNIQNLGAGSYLFKVTVSDSGAQWVREKSIPFKIRRQVIEPVSYEGLPYYEEIEYFVSAKEYGYFKALDKAGKESYLKKFWSRRNYYTIADKFEYAREKYKEGNKPGYKTDRGRIYIRYGEPDEIEEGTIDIEVSKPYKQWDYYTGIKFIFVDIRGTNEYTLIWTNAPGERSQPSLYGYLPEAKRREFNLE